MPIQDYKKEVVILTVNKQKARQKPRLNVKICTNFICHSLQIQANYTLLLRQLAEEKEEKNMENKKIGVLLANLGTDAPTVADVKRYLKQFLSDPPSDRSPQTKMANNLRIALLLPKRSPKWQNFTKRSIGKIPLLAISRKQQKAVQNYFNAKGKEVVVELGMTCGNQAWYKRSKT